MADSRPPYDDLETDYLEEENESGFLSLVSVIVAFVAVAVFIALAWYAYRSGGDTVSMKDIEVVYPDEGPVKEAPQDPGGWQFPHQDKSVYDVIGNGGEQNAEVKVEKIMPAPEQPVDRPEAQTETWISEDAARQQAASQQAIAQTDAERIKEAKEHPAAAVKPASPESAPAKAAEPSQPAQAVQVAQPAVKQESAAPSSAAVTAVAPAVVPVAPVDDKPAAMQQPVVAEAKSASAPVVTPVAPKVPAPTVKKAPTPAPAAVVASAVKSGVRVQLGAFRSRSDAEAQWRKLQGKFGGALAGTSSQIERADLGAKGVFYRLQAAPFRDKATAQRACATLSDQKQACFVVVK